MSSIASRESLWWGSLSIFRSEKVNSPGDRSGRAIMVIAMLVMLLLITMLSSLCIGATGTSFFSVIGNLLTGSSSTSATIIIFEIRLPRMILGVLVGSSLAVSGAVMQGLFRNPLADPGLVGVSAGASLAAVSVIVLGTSILAPVAALLGKYMLPFAAFGGGLITTIILYTIATRRGQTSVATMLLGGIALAALAGALSGVLIYISDDLQMRDLIFWQMGSLGGATWEKIGISAPFILLSFMVIPLIGSGLNALVLGEAEAKYMGVRVQLLKRAIILMVACSVGACVAVSGAIGFIGIVVPHLLRLLIGPDHRYILPASALLGASLLLVADSVSRVVVAPAELPIGIVTAALGGPFFLWILLRQRSILDL